ncbi:glycosyltransferase [Halobacterium hubeiense]|uniref:glycosyltransferase n=1 Tax=Halobacterium hubeiense TaxID=1407499 RepID=UPI003C78D9E0
MKRYGASVILPTYEEAATAPTVVTELVDTLDRDHELIVVDDSPTRDTVNAVEAATDDVTTIHRQGDGLASAVLDGIDQATHEAIAVLDGDGQHPPSAVCQLLEEIDDGADVAVGSRHSEDGGVAADWPTHRRIISHGATALAWAFVPPARETSDPMSGLFAARRAYVDAVRDQLDPAGYKILLEILARAPVEDVTESGYVFQAREAGESNLGAREYVDYVRHLCRLAAPSRVPRIAVPVSQEVLDE